MQTLDNYDAETISIFFSQRKLERYLVPLMLNQIGLGTKLKKTSEEKVMNNLMFQVTF